VAWCVPRRRFHDDRPISKHVVVSLQLDGLAAFQGAIDSEERPLLRLVVGGRQTVEEPNESPA
jgi:hypothetical protein